MSALIGGVLKPGSLLSQSKRLTSSGRLLELNNLTNIPGSKRKRSRWGRGTGSGRGKLCGFGHQKSFSTPNGFEGGQTPKYKLYPKIGFNNPNHREIVTVSTKRIQEFIDMGRLTVPANQMITIRDLFKVGLISKVGDGVKLLQRENMPIRTPIHIEVSQASAGAIASIEAAGGTVTCCHFNTLALRAVVKPYKFQLLPRRARPPPRYMDYYLDKNKCGYLSPEIQMRNLKLFGAVTSEDAYRRQHDAYMQHHRNLVKERNAQLEAAAKELVAKGKMKWLAKVWGQNEQA